MVTERLPRAFALALALQACAPELVTYVRPDAPGGRHVPSRCGGVSGPAQRLLLAAPEQVRVAVSMESISELMAVGRLPRVEGRADHGWAILVVLAIPSDPPAEVRFVSKELVLTTAGGTVHRRTIERALASPSRVVYDVYAMVGPDLPGSPRPSRSLDEPLASLGKADWHIAPGLWHGVAIDQPYYLVVIFDGVSVEDFTLALPELLIGTTPWSPPPVRFRVHREWYISGMNC
jgi:hypothetical protein